MSQVLLRCLKNLNPRLLANCHQVFINQKATRLILYVKDKKGGYKTEIKKDNKELVKLGYEAIKKGIPEFKEEIVESFKGDALYPGCHGDYEIFWKFDGAESLKNWVVTADSDHNEGYSKASLDITPNNKAVFHGYLDPTVPKDGVIKKTGFVNVKSPRKYKAFYRPAVYDWSRYTHFYFRVRGDGRAYNINVAIDYDIDILYHDLFVFPLFTRGGPYWQLVKVPFSKFFLSAAGRIQDKQESLVSAAHMIKHISLTLADEAEGPFKLELDFIAVVRDMNHPEKYAYEMYRENSAYIGT